MNDDKKDIQKETLKPITNAYSRLDKEIQIWELESTKGRGELDQ
jgi:hypothetical protein